MNSIQQRFKRPTGPDDARKQCREILGSYYHPDCDTTTIVSEDILDIVAMDPSVFPFGETECAGCESARMKEVHLPNGQTLHDALKDLHKSMSIKAQLAKGLSFSLVLIPLFAIAGIIAGFTIVVPEKRGFSWQLMVAGAVVGLFAGLIPSALCFRMLRKRGFFW